MFAGIVSLNKNTIDNQTKSEMKASFSRSKKLPIQEIFFKQNCFFLKSNTKALTSYSGIYTKNNKVVSLMAGEPLVSINGIENDHFLIIQALKYDDNKILRSVRGVFCIAKYTDNYTPLLELCTDKLGIRPVYYWTDGDLVIFSTVLKVLEDITIVPKIADHVALSEIVGFGFPLGNRTKYEHIKLLRESEIIRFTVEGAKSFTYWRWDTIEQKQIPVKEATTKAYNIFREAIRLRLQDDTSVLAFLSGGMDSRAIVSIIADFGLNLKTFNFSPTNSQDQVLAVRFADIVGCKLKLWSRDGAMSLDFRRQLARLVSSLVQNTDATRPRAIWSGDGGSVSLGCVYLDEKIIELMRSSNRNDAIKAFRKKNWIGLPLRAIKNSKKKEMSELLDQVIVAELDRLECLDHGQMLFLLLMINDQRRHLHDVYEDIDIHNLEYQLPFFDSVFLEFIFSLPLDYRLNHQFYTDWFNVLPQSVRMVPWQTYPGHVPCPLPIDKNLGYQWHNKKLTVIEKLKNNWSFGTLGLKISLFSPTIGPLSRYKLLSASVIHLLGIRNYDYVINAGKIYSDIK